jgi:hypothetical protein
MKTTEYIFVGVEVLKFNSTSWWGRDNMCSSESRNTVHIFFQPDINLYLAHTSPEHRGVGWYEEVDSCKEKAISKAMRAYSPYVLIETLPAVYKEWKYRYTEIDEVDFDKLACMRAGLNSSLQKSSIPLVSGWW